ncbi:Hypothetical protein, predicted transmembrane protein, putative protease [Metamycoplasma auris 15026]|uniref:Tail specific protease domain-containing protein n=1 Tax=Metamycoplasma auris 15026 TaxID=1188233 RepID=N9VAT0_9BACT|nr:S41 family peptidase [Metamycoplasma auris]ENY68521.1 Hypothetical protein, predicted transmembrane protein, putative protease [Metamycoplasma auris 15026]
MKLGKKTFIFSLLVNAILPMSLLSFSVQNKNTNKRLNNKNKLLKNNSSSTFKLKEYEFSDLTKNNSNELKKIELGLYNDVAYIGIKEFLKATKTVTNFNDYSFSWIKLNNKLYKKQKYLEHNFKDNKVTLNVINKLVNDSDPDDQIQNKYSIEIDFQTKKINVSNYKFFTEILKDYKRGEEELQIEFLSKKNLNEKTHFSYDLSKYDIEILKDKKDLYLPVVLLNQILLNESNYQTYFNGEYFNLFNYFETLGSSYGPALLKQSNVNNENIPLGLKEFQYKYFPFLFDYYYGIKNKNNQSYKNFFATYEDDILAENDNHYLATKDIINDLGDLHSTSIIDGYYNHDNDAIKNIEKEFRKIRRIRKRAEIENELGKRDFGKIEYSITYTPDRKTGIISFRAFDKMTASGIEKSLEIAKNEGIKNIVFNITVNSGGYVGSAFEIMGFMTNKPFYSYTYNPLSQEKSVEEIKSKYKKYDFNYFILTSPFSFSAANILAQMVKDNKVAKVIGYKTHGGASAINYAILPTGDIIQISSNHVFSDKNFNNIEFGVKPDIFFEEDIYKNQDQLYDLNYIQQIVNKETNEEAKQDISFLIKNPNLGLLKSSDFVSLYEALKNKNPNFNIAFDDLEFQSINKIPNEKNEYEVSLKIKDNNTNYFGTIKLIFSLEENAKPFNPNGNTEDRNEKDKNNADKNRPKNKKTLRIILGIFGSLLVISLILVIVFLVLKLKKKTKQ